jgi:fatty acyl-CoA reductase
LQVFDRVLKEFPNAFDSKLVPMEGDMTLPQLGLSVENYKILSENVSIIFHVAATIRFNESLVDAVQMNTLGTRETVDLAFNMHKLVVEHYLFY